MRKYEGTENEFIYDSASSLPAGDYAGPVERLEKVAGPVRMNNGSFSDIAYEATTAIAALVAERDSFKRMCRESYEAFSAMRNDINELIGDMPSQESTLASGPEMSHECAAVVEAVRKRAEAAEAQVKAMDEALEDTARIDFLREMCGYVEDGSNTRIVILQDDAAKEWLLRIGDKCPTHASSFRGVIDSLRRARAVKGGE